MKNLVNELVTHLKNLEYPVIIKAIRDSHSKANPVYPMIVVDEVNNSSRFALKGEERLSNLVYQIDIFSKDMVVGLTPTSGKNICRDISHVVDAEMNSEYGLTRTSAVETPDNNDSTVSRCTLRYSGILDLKSDLMYR